MSFVNDTVNNRANHAPPVDPTDIVGRRVWAFLLDFLIVGVLSLFIGVAGLTNAFETESVEFDSVDDAIAFCDEANSGSPDVIGGDPICIPADVEAVQISFDSSEGNAAVLPIAHGALWFLQILLQAFTGATIGKFITGVRVVREDGRRPGLVRSAVRTIAYFIDGFPWFPPMLLGLIASVTSKRHRRLGDRLAGTFVVNKAAAGYPVPPAYLFDVRLPPETGTASAPRPTRDPVTGKLPPPAMPGSPSAAPANDAVAAGAAAAARRRSNPLPKSPTVPASPPQPTVVGAEPSPPTPSPTGEFAGGRPAAGVAMPSTDIGANTPNVAAPGIDQPTVPRPTVIESTVAQPTIAQPAVAQPTITQPAVAQPTIEQPAVRQPLAQPPVGQQPVTQQPTVAQQPAMPDGVMWDAARNAYIYSDGSRFLQWDAGTNAWVELS